MREEALSHWAGCAAEPPFPCPKPFEPLAWRRHNGRPGSGRFSGFTPYSANSMAKWMKLRGFSYDVLLSNGQLVVVHPKPVTIRRLG